MSKDGWIETPDFDADDGEVMTYTQIATMRFKSVKPQRIGGWPEHWSSCSLHNGPAWFPMPCDCGGFTPGREYGDAPDRAYYSPISRLRRFLQLWKARLDWKRETSASLTQCFMALRIAKARHRRHGAQLEH